MRHVLLAIVASTLLAGCGAAPYQQALSASSFGSSVTFARSAQASTIVASVTMQKNFVVAPGRETAFQTFLQGFMAHYNLSYKAIPARSTSVPGTVFTVAVVGQNQMQLAQIFAGLAQQWAMQR